MVDTVRSQAQLLAFLHPNIPNAAPDATVLQAQSARDLIVSTILGNAGVDQTIGTGDVQVVPGATANGLLTIVLGSVAVPNTSNTRKGLYISMRSAMTVVNDDNALVWATHINNGATQPVAFRGYAQNVGAGDAATFYSQALAVTGRAYGFYGVASVSSHASGTPGAIPFNAVISNFSGADASLATLGVGSNPFIAALYVQANVGSGNVNGFGILLGSGINLDAGFYIQAGAVVTVSFRDDSNAVRSIQINGVRTTGIEINSVATNGIDSSGATLSGYHLKMSGTSGIGFIGGTGPAFFGDTNDYLTYNQAGNLYQFLIASAATLQFGTGSLAFTGLPTASPGAGSKQFWYDAADSNRVKYAA